MPLQPHNILVQKTTSEEGVSYLAKIADLGTACKMKENEKLHDCVGTSGYTGKCLATDACLLC